MELIILLADGANSLMYNNYFFILSLLVGLDYFTGILKEVLWKVVDSAVGLKGLTKHTRTLTTITTNPRC